MGDFLSQSTLADALCDLLEHSPQLQAQILRHATAVACVRTQPDNEPDAVVPFQQGASPAGHPTQPRELELSYPRHQSDQSLPPFSVKQTAQDPGHLFGSMELSLVLDVFEVALASPFTCGALLHTTCAVVDVAASAAVLQWLRLYAQRHHHFITSWTHRDEREMDGDGVSSSQRQPPVWQALCNTEWPPWPETWWTALESKSVTCQVRVVLLHIPSAYEVLTVEGNTAEANHLSFALQRGAVRLKADSTAQRSLVLSTRESRNSLGDISFITSAAPSLKGLPSVSEGSTPHRLLDNRAPTITATVTCRASIQGARTIDPSDGFLEATPLVQVVGVVQHVYYESRRAVTAAPWLTLRLFSPASHAGPFSPRSTQREINLTALDSRVVAAVAVLGEVILVRGHAQVARRPTVRSAKGGKAGGEALLQVRLLASWAAPLLQRLSVNVRSETWCAQADQSRSRLAAPAEVDTAAGLELTGWEEEQAARMALSCWEGTRLALSSPRAQVNGATTESACVPSLLFSATLDVVLGMQLAVLSAQLEDGVVAMLIDETLPSLTTLLVDSLDCIARTATGELPSTVLCRASPSYFLPSYHVQSPPAAAAAASAGEDPQARHQLTTGGVNNRDRPRPYTARPPLPPPPAPPQLKRPRENGHALAAAAVAAPAPPLFSEVLKGGALTQACGRALVLQGIESLPVGTLKMLQEALRAADDDRPDEGADGATEPAATIVAADGRAGDKHHFVQGQALGRSELTNERAAHLPITQDAEKPDAIHSARHVVERQGGQHARYFLTHAALCTVRHGARLAEKSHLFEFAQRCDVVLRPAFDRRRQAAALQAAVDPSLHHLLHRRGTQWAKVLQGVYAVPSSVEGGASITPAATSAGQPTLTEACNRLLSAYFVAAKAVGGEGADASMMTTLVKLTLAHAEWRRRCTVHCRRQGSRKPSGKQGVLLHNGMSKLCETSAMEEEVSEPLDSGSALPQGTALIDALVAVGLCDATLHFFTGKTLLDECVLQLLEREAWPIWAAEEAQQQEERRASSSVRCVAAMNEEEETCEDDPCWRLPDMLCPERDAAAQQLYQEVNFRTRLDPQPPAADCEPTSVVSVFSIQQLVQDLLTRLEHVTLSAAPPSYA